MSSKTNIENNELSKEFIQNKYDESYKRLESIRNELDEIKEITKESINKLKNSTSKNTLEVLAYQIDNHCKILKQSMELEKQISDSINKNVNAIKNISTNDELNGLSFNPTDLLQEFSKITS